MNRVFLITHQNYKSLKNSQIFWPQYFLRWHVLSITMYLSHLHPPVHTWCIKYIQLNCVPCIFLSFSHESFLFVWNDCSNVYPPNTDRDKPITYCGLSYTTVYKSGLLSNALTDYDWLGSWDDSQGYILQKNLQQSCKYLQSHKMMF